MSSDASPALSGKPLDAPAHPALSLPDHATRWLALVLALACGLLGLGLASHYPLQPPLAIALYLAVLAASFRWWQAAPLLLIGLVPVLGLATWTGWFIFEELDLLVMAAAAGGYAAYALGRADSKTSAWRRPLAPSALAKLLLMLFSASVLLSVWRGLQDAGGLEFGWWQGYLESLNSPRQAKGLAYALLLLPLWQRASASRPGRVERGMLFAMCLALAGISLAALWERAAFPGLLNFSANYRSTAMFWEMQVGGATLDGALLLCIPFALAALLRQRSPHLILLLLVLLLLAVYAALTTFSRGVYLALPLMLALQLLLMWRQQRAQTQAMDAQPQHLEGLLRALPWLVLLGLFGYCADAVFGVGGYRGLLGLAGSALLLLLAARELQVENPTQRLLMIAAAVMFGALGTALSWSITMWLPKAAYALYPLAFGLCLLLIRQPALLPESNIRALAVSSLWFWCLGCAAVMAGNWGGSAMLWATIEPVALWGFSWVFLIGLAPAACRQLRAARGGWSLLPFAALVALGALAVVQGPDFQPGRSFIASRPDLEQRLQHLRSSYWLLHGDEQRLLGLGSGRFVATRFYAGAQDDRSGDFRLVDADGVPALRLSGGRATAGVDDLLRLSQRVGPHQGPLKFQASVRTTEDLSLRVELGAKHLIQALASDAKQLKIGGKPGWRPVTLTLQAVPGQRGDWWAPRLMTFSMALESSGRTLDMRDLHLLDASGHDLLANGDLRAGLAHWYFSSDREHLPWHLKNLFLHIVFEQGWLGLAAWGALVAAALWRCAFGRARAHPLAPALVTALAGFLLLGLVDSLLDAPRLAFMFYSVLLLGLCLRALPPGLASDSRH